MEKMYQILVICRVHVTVHTGDYTMNTVITPTRTRKSNVITMKDGFALIHITSKKHGTFIAQIDLDDLPEVSQYCWCVKYMKNNWSYYAYTSVRQDDGSIYQSG